MTLNYPDRDLYHYTSLNTLLSIIENKTIRLTDYRFLNDTQELSFAINELRNVLKGIPADDYCKKISNALDDIENGNITIFPAIGKLNGVTCIAPQSVQAKYYVLSLSSQQDSLPMWRMYAKTGCCIKFNNPKMMEFFHAFRDKYFADGLSNVVNESVIYGSSIPKDKEFIQWLLSSKNDMMLYEMLLHWCLLRKISSFAYEKEFRIAFPFEDKLLNEQEHKVFTIVDNVIKPQIELRNFMPNEVIEEIIISPYITSELTLLGIQELLSTHGINPHIVHPSKISIR